MTASLPSADSLVKSRGALSITGIFFILVGIFAICFPLAASAAIEQVIGVVLVITGVFSLGAVIFGAEKNHRIATVVLALIRLAAGILFLIYFQAGVKFLTILLGAFFAAEGVTFIISSLALRHNRAWPLIFVNGLVAILLAVLIFKSYPFSATWATGLLYGINSIFYGVALLGFAAAHGKGA